MFENVAPEPAGLTQTRPDNDVRRGLHNTLAALGDVSGKRKSDVCVYGMPFRFVLLLFYFINASFGKYFDVHKSCSRST